MFLKIALLQLLPGITARVDRMDAGRQVLPENQLSAGYGLPV